ncbi:hypothetical protein KSP40_PGU006779 [Platanthera guangdongensis]|uniref:Uncharacterized protein n=1 Tax=Platanthera guangdongensis TaxID=2320717 RepID=A0ABR2MTR3_9ASPA
MFKAGDTRKVTTQLLMLTYYILAQKSFSVSDIILSMMRYTFLLKSPDRQRYQSHVEHGGVEISFDTSLDIEVLDLVYSRNNNLLRGASLQSADLSLYMRNNLCNLALPLSYEDEDMQLRWSELFKIYDDHPYHISCCQNQHHKKCDVCKEIKSDPSRIKTLFEATRPPPQPAAFHRKPQVCDFIACAASLPQSAAHGRAPPAYGRKLHAAACVRAPMTRSSEGHLSLPLIAGLP